MSPSLRRPAPLLAGLALLLPAAAQAAPPPRASATPDQLRAYVSSGAYLRDVEAAVAPARAALAARLDALDAARGACTAAGLSVGPSAPPPARAATARAATPTVGATRITLRRDALRRAGIAAQARAFDLPATAATVRAGTATVTQRGTIALRRGGRTITLRALRMTLTRKRLTVTAAVGGRRVAVLRSTAAPRRTTLAAASGRASAIAVPVGVPTAGVRALRAAGLRGRHVGIVTVRVATRGTATPGAPAATTAPAAGGGFVPTGAACAALPTRPAMVLDIDETALSAYLDGAGGDPGGGAAGQYPELVGTAVALPPVLALYRYAISRGVAVDFITARITPQLVPTYANLDRAGYGQRIGVTFRSSTSEDPGVYKRDARRALQAQGYTILLNVGDQCSDLFDGQAEQAFKLPNTFYFTQGAQDAACNPDA